MVFKRGFQALVFYVQSKKNDVTLGTYINSTDKSTSNLVQNQMRFYFENKGVSSLEGRVNNQSNIFIRPPGDF